MSPRTGRPPSTNPRTEVVPIRLTKDELTVIKTAADSAGKAAGEFIREKALSAAKRKHR